LYTSECIYDGASEEEALPKSVTRTLRLDEDIDAALERMAEEAGESVNFIAEKALRKLVEWDRLAESAGLVVISPITLGRLMDSQTVEEARALGRSIGRDVWRPIIISIFGEVSLTSTLEALRRIARYMGRFEFHYATEEPKNVITIRHHGGIKWSAFYLGAADSMFGEALGLETKSSMTEELATLEFNSPKQLRVE
jgi:predicted transcriptional regulator